MAVNRHSHQRQFRRVGCGGAVFPLALAAAMVFSPVRAQDNSAATLQQAKVVTGEAVFAPPPRTITDITAILDQQKPDPAAVAANKTKADASPPAGLDGIDLARFYSDRGTAAGDLGRESQRLDDYRKAFAIVEPLKDRDLGFYANLTNQLASAETRAGHLRAALKLRQGIVDYFESTVETQTGKNKKRNQHRGTLFAEYRGLVQLHVGFGQFGEAQADLAKLDQLRGQSASWKNVNGYIDQWGSLVDWAHGAYLNATGKQAEAETFLKKAVAENLTAVHTLQAVASEQLMAITDSIEASQSFILLSLGNNLTRQGRLFEAESAVRLALLQNLKKRGHYASETATALSTLGFILSEQGRVADAETVDRAAIDIYTKLGQSPDSSVLNTARSELASVLVAQRRYKDAMAEFDVIRQGLAGDPAELAKMVDNNLGYSTAALRVGRIPEALRAAKAAADSREKALGPKHYNTAEARAFYAAALAASGDRAGALAQYQSALGVLLISSRGSADEQGSVAGRQRRLRFILESYLHLLTDHGALAGDSPDSAEAFRIADAARGQALQQALVASAARAAVHDPGLSDLVRREQDALRQISALNAVLASALALPEDQQDTNSIQQVRSRIDQLRDARATLRETIEKGYPDYVSLIDPRPITLADARAALRPSQALIVTYVAEDRTYIWALRGQGPVAFALAPLGAAEIDKQVANLRRALDPDVETLADVPRFDVAGANRLYDSLLRPVEAGWRGADDLLVVAHRSLAELPFGLLVTNPVTVLSDQPGKPPFEGYQKVPWLIREASITSLPSVASLKALATLAAAPAAPKPFVGFGDPWFNAQEAQEGRAEEAAAAIQLASTAGSTVTMRGAKMKFRSAPATTGSANADIGVLPRLPDTADEVRAAARALDADPSKDVYLGLQANEHTVTTVKLDDRRVVMFATHGLVPGDLTDLAEPALALTASSVSGMPGNGLLTTTKILGLRLNADWVVLSACNTAAGNGAGAQAVSGLGLAFIYAGARSVLVSNWPVETTSARALTTTAFRQLVQKPGTSRAQAVRAAMLSLIDGPGYVDQSGKPLFSYAHPIFWAPFTLVGDGGDGPAG
jgi:CHAT domain-containing protein